MCAGGAVNGKDHANGDSSHGELKAANLIVQKAKTQKVSG